MREGGAASRNTADHDERRGSPQGWGVPRLLQVLPHVIHHLGSCQVKSLAAPRPVCAWRDLQKTLDLNNVHASHTSLPLRLLLLLLLLGNRVLGHPERVFHAQVRHLPQRAEGQLAWLAVIQPFDQHPLVFLALSHSDYSSVGALVLRYKSLTRRADGLIAAIQIAPAG